MKLLKNLLQILQIICVFCIPLGIIQHYFANEANLIYIQNANKFFLDFFAQFMSPNFLNTDWVILFIILPWILFIIVIGFLVNFLEYLNVGKEVVVQNIVTQKVKRKIEEQKKVEKEKLLKKQAVYLVIELIFTKFTISSLSEMEIANKKNEIKNELLKSVYVHRGKLNKEDIFNNEDTVAILFYSQEDTLDFIIKFRESVKFLEDKIQQYGYILGYKAIVDIQLPDANKHFVLQFLEKALKTVNVNQVYTTNDFVTKYLAYGKNKNILYSSLGNYSINRERVDLYRIEF